MRDRLIALLQESSVGVKESEWLANCLLTDGVIVPPHKPINVMRVEDSTDVCCPYCDTNLSGLYGEEPTSIIQCYVCGEYLDNTEAITREEAEQALKGESHAEMH